jgi:hypothetical protein
VRRSSLLGGSLACGEGRYERCCYLREIERSQSGLMVRLL